MKLSSTIIATAGVLSLIAGCTPIKTLPDGRVLAATTVNDSLDRSATYVQILQPTGVDSEGNPTGYQQVAGDLTVGNTVAGDTIRAGVPTVLGGLIQRDAAIRSAEIKSDGAKCPEGTQVCNSNVLQGGNSQSVAQQTADARSNSNVTYRQTTTSCPECRLID